MIIYVHNLKSFIGVRIILQCVSNLMTPILNRNSLKVNSAPHCVDVPRAFGRYISSSHKKTLTMNLRFPNSDDVQQKYLCVYQYFYYFLAKLFMQQCHKTRHAENIIVSNLELLKTFFSANYKNSSGWFWLQRIFFKNATVK